VVVVGLSQQRNRVYEPAQGVFSFFAEYGAIIDHFTDSSFVYLLFGLGAWSAGRLLDVDRYFEETAIVGCLAYLGMLLLLRFDNLTPIFMPKTDDTQLHVR